MDEFDARPPKNQRLADISAWTICRFVNGDVKIGPTRSD